MILLRHRSGRGPRRLVLAGASDCGPFGGAPPCAADNRSVKVAWASAHAATMPPLKPWVDLFPRGLKPTLRLPWVAAIGRAADPGSSPAEFSRSSTRHFAANRRVRDSQAAFDLLFDEQRLLHLVEARQQFDRRRVPHPRADLVGPMHTALV